MEKKEIGGACSKHGAAERYIQGSCEKLEGKRQLGRPMRRWEDNIKMYFQELQYGDMDWIDLTQDRESWRALVNAVTNFRVP
jgi:hypothetical protein